MTPPHFSIQRTEIAKGNPSLIRGIYRSVRDVGENLIAGTSASPVTQRIVQRSKAWTKDSLVTFTQKNQIDPLDKVPKTFMADRQILPRFSDALPQKTNSP